MDWIRRRREERKRKRQAVRQTAQRSDQLPSDTEQADVDPTVTTPTQRMLDSLPTRYFSVRHERGASTGLSNYEQLPNNQEPKHPNKDMQQANGSKPPSNPFATPPHNDTASVTGLTPTPTPEANNTSNKTWLDRVGGSIRRKPSVIDAFKTSNIRSAWSYTLPRNWKTNNTAAAKALNDAATQFKNSQARRLPEDEKRSPLPRHWREESNNSQQTLPKRMIGVAVVDAEMEDWNDPDEVKTEQEFEDWLVQNKVFVEEWDPHAEEEEDKRSSRVSVQIKRKYSDY